MIEYQWLVTGAGFAALGLLIMNLRGTIENASEAGSRDLGKLRDQIDRLNAFLLAREQSFRREAGRSGPQKDVDAGNKPSTSSLSTADRLVPKYIDDATAARVEKEQALRNGPVGFGL